MQQHTVSEVLLRRWADADGQVAVFDVRSKRSISRAPAGVGWIEDFVRVLAQETEELWQTAVENRLSATFQAVDEGLALDDAETVETLRNCLAMHWARSRTFQVIFGQLLKEAREKARRDMARDPKIVDLFHGRYGIWPAGWGALDALADDFAEQIVNELAGDFFRERVLANFEKAKEHTLDAGLQIAVATDGELVISDDPAQSLRAGHSGVGPLGGVPWMTADTIVLPLGPRHLLAFGAVDEWAALDAAGVRAINGAEVASAHERVVYRLEADLHDEVRSLREAADRNARSAAQAPPPG